MAVRINSFSPWDYVVFVGMLIVSMGIGVFFALKGRNQNNTQGEYLLAGKSMSIIPVSISILVSFMSAILILGTPAEMYTQSIIYYLSSFGICLGILMAALFFVPLIYPLKITSAFEYLELRFNSKAARLTGTALMILTQVIYMGIATFAPSTALEAVTGFPVWATILIIGVVGTFYTSIGGMKAVVWTDVFQSLVMVAGILAIVIQGVIKVGSFSKIFEINQEWGKAKFDQFSFDPTVRHTVWGLVIGSSLTWVGTYGINQSSVQRYCSLPTLRKAQISVLLNAVGIVFLFTITCFSGIVVFAYYVIQNCDPLGKKLVDNPNQIIPFFVMETLSYPCVPGIFISSLFSGALSSVSSSLNALAAITWIDMIKPLVKSKMPESRQTFITKMIVVFYGILGVGMSFVAQNLEGTVLQAAISLIGAAGAPLNGMFVLGAFFPWANAKGAITGAICGLGMGFWLAIGSYAAGIPKDEYPMPNGTCSAYLPNTTIATAFTTTVMPITTIEPTVEERTGLDDMYTISYLWFNSIGVLTCVIVGLIVSFITGANSVDDVPVKYQIPIFTRICCCMPRSWKKVLQCNREFPNPEAIRAEEKNTEYDVPPPGYDDSNGKTDFDKSNGKADFDNEGFEMEEKPAKDEPQNGLNHRKNEIKFEKNVSNILVQRL